jgi:hypothetical protein
LRFPAQFRLVTPVLQGCTAPQLARLHGMSTISSLVRSDSGEQQEQQVWPMRYKYLVVDVWRFTSLYRKLQPLPKTSAYFRR